MPFRKGKERKEEREKSLLFDTVLWHLYLKDSNICIYIYICIFAGHAELLRFVNINKNHHYHNSL